MFGSHGDAPKVVIAASTIEDCFYAVITARKIAETFNMVVVVLTDAALATSQTPFTRPKFNEAWLAPPIDQSPIPPGAKPYDWIPTPGLRAASSRGSRAHAHGDRPRPRPALPRRVRPRHQRGEPARAQPQAGRAAAHAQGAADLRRRRGRLLVIGWGSTKGTIEEAVQRCATRASSLVDAPAVPPADGPASRRRWPGSGR